MTIWYPQKLQNNEDISLYFTKCSFSVGMFQMALRNNINLPCLKRIEQIMKKYDILDFTNKENFSINNVLNQYIGSLICKYDEQSTQCYYTISKITKCVNTTNNLDFVIRLIEFGNDKIPPTAWIRKSYKNFCDVVMGKNV